MVSSTIKAVIISTGITVIALFLYLPIALDFSLSQSPILWSSFLSWLKPPYLFVVINVIITIIVASSSYHDGEEEEEVLYGGDYKIDQTEQIEVKEVNLDPDFDYSDPDFDFPATFSDPIVVAEVERLEVVCEETEEESSGVINGGDETSKLNQVLSPSMVEESENIAPAEEPLVTASSGHRKPVKASQKGGKSKRKALKVAKPKRVNETVTMENTWKVITEEGKSTTLTVHHRRSDTVGVDVGEVKQRVLRKTVTFRDMTNYQKSPTTVTSPVKMKEEMSPSREELNRRVEEFIKKCKEERLLESMRLDKVVVA